MQLLTKGLVPAALTLGSDGLLCLQLPTTSEPPQLHVPAVFSFLFFYTHMRETHMRETVLHEAHA